MIQKLSLLALLIVILLASLIGCASKPAQPETIRIAALPVLDTLPIYVAQEEGLFQKRNLTVEAIPVSSAPKRDELINAAQADGMINEVMSTIFHNRDETRVQIVRYGRVATENSPIFYILASGKSGVTTVEGLRGTPIGVSQGTIIEYLTDRLLQAEGFSNEEINTIAVPDIGQRMALLNSGELPAAMLPDPLASLVMQQNAAMIIDDSAHPQYSYSTLAFRKEFIDKHPDAVRDFLAAWEEAIQMINEHPEKYADLMSEQKLVPPPLAGKFSVPQFVTASVPTQAQWDDAMAWIAEKGLDAGQASYETTVTKAFLP